MRIVIDTLEIAALTVVAFLIAIPIGLGFTYLVNKGFEWLDRYL